MNKEDQLKVQAWMDGELAPKESSQMSDLIESDIQAKELAQELKAVQNAIKIGEIRQEIEDSKEFYWGQVQQKIESIRPVREQSNQRTPSNGAIPALRWLIPVGSLTAISALIIHFNGLELGSDNGSSANTPSGIQPTGYEPQNSGLSESGGIGIMEEEVSQGAELGVFSFEGTKTGWDFSNPEDPNSLPESIENPEH
tara:strand:- start:310 stop:903 length:594 start_codon:yes stop_codon:yes gene_type:complete